jgi:hypothetical protein
MEHTEIPGYQTLAQDGQAGRASAGTQLFHNQTTSGSSHLSITRGGSMERPMSIAVMDENTPAVHKSEHRIERPMSIAVVGDDLPPVHHDTRGVARDDAQVVRRNVPPGQRQVPSLQRLPHPGAAATIADHSMRVPYFVESCPHVRDQIIRMNGGRFNVDHYLRVLRAKAELDESIAMALTVAGERGIAARAVRPFTLAR